MPVSQQCLGSACFLYSSPPRLAAASAIALAEAGQFREAAEWAKRAAERLYETAKDLFEKAKVALQRLVELLVEAVARALAWADAHRAYLFLMAAVAAGLVSLAWALDVYGLVELWKLSAAALGAEPYSHVVARRLEEALQKRWGCGMKEFEAAFRNALSKIAEAHGKTGETLGRIDAGRGVFTVTKDELAGFKKAWREALDAVEEFRKTTVRLAQKPELRSKLEIDEIAARMLAVATVNELPAFDDLNEGTKAYAALLSIAKGGIYGHAASILLKEGRLADLPRNKPYTAYEEARKLARAVGEPLHPSRVEKAGAVARALFLLIAGLDDEAFNKLGDVKVVVTRRRGRAYVNLYRAGEEPLSWPLARLAVGKNGVARLVGGSLFEGLKRTHETAFSLLESWLAQTREAPDAREVMRFFEEALKKTPVTPPGKAPGKTPTPHDHVEIPPYGRLPLLLGWLASDVTLEGNYVRVETTQLWQFAALRMLLGKPAEWKIEYFSATLKGLKPVVEMKWPREVLDEVVREDEWVKQLISGRAEKFDDFIRGIDWDAVVDAVKRVRNTLVQHIACKDGETCGEQRFDEMLRELKDFIINKLT